MPDQEGHRRSGEPGRQGTPSPRSIGQKLKNGSLGQAYARPLIPAHMNASSNGRNLLGRLRQGARGQQDRPDAPRPGPDETSASRSSWAAPARPAPLRLRLRHSMGTIAGYAAIGALRRRGALSWSFRASASATREDCGGFENAPANRPDPPFPFGVRACLPQQTEGVDVRLLPSSWPGSGCPAPLCGCAPCARSSSMMIGAKSTLDQALASLSVPGEKDVDPASLSPTMSSPTRNILSATSFGRTTSTMWSMLVGDLGLGSAAHRHVGAHVLSRSGVGWNAAYFPVDRGATVHDEQSHRRPRSPLGR